MTLKSVTPKSVTPMCIFPYSCSTTGRLNIKGPSTGHLLIKCISMSISDLINMILSHKSQISCTKSTVYDFTLTSSSSQRSKCASRACSAKDGKKRKKRAMNCEARRFSLGPPFTADRISKYSASCWNINDTGWIKKRMPSTLWAYDNRLSTNVLGKSKKKSITVPWVLSHPSTLDPSTDEIHS